MDNQASAHAAAKILTLVSKLRHNAQQSDSNEYFEPIALHTFCIYWIK